MSKEQNQTEEEKLKYRPPKWKVEHYVKNLHDPTLKKTHFEKINLLVTLTWGLTHNNLYRDWDLDKVLKYMSEGAQVRDKKNPDPSNDKKTLSVPAKNAKKDDYIKHDISGILQSICAIRRPQSGDILAEGISLECLYWGDCRRNEQDFPTTELWHEFQRLRAAGLDLEFYDRFALGNENLLPEDPVEKERIEKLLAKHGHVTLAQYYDMNELDLRRTGLLDLQW